MVKKIPPFRNMPRTKPKDENKKITKKIITIKTDATILPLDKIKIKMKSMKREKSYFHHPKRNDSSGTFMYLQK